MTVIYCFSGAGHSKAAAGYISERIGVPVTEIKKGTTDASSPADAAVLVFPVYCQNIPAPVRALLFSLKAGSTALIAVYGGICHGNVLWEASRITKSRIIAGAYVPTGHTYLREGTAGTDFSALLPLINKINNHDIVSIPREHKDLFADFFPDWRSRTGVEITRSDKCTDCGLCTERCPVGAMHGGIPDRSCIRCLRCVTECPEQALDFSLRSPMKLYFDIKRKRDTDITVYIQ